MRTRLIPLLQVLVLPVVVAAQSPPPIYVAPVVPPTLRLLDDPTVEKEIGLTAAQKATAAKVRQGWSIPAQEIHLGRFGRVSPEAFRVGANARTAEFLSKGLTKEQRTRLNQILFQLREKEFGPYQALAMAARDLGLRSDQLEDVRNLKALRVEEIDKAVTSGKRFERIKVEVQVANGETYDKMAEMLTRAQRERLKELRGKPLTGKFGESVPVRTGPKYPAMLFGYYDLELRYLAEKSVRQELKVTDAQAGGLDRAIERWRTEFEKPGHDAEFLAQGLYDLTNRALEEHLTAAQQERLAQIMMRRRARAGLEAAAGHPAAVRALKLTPNQLRQLASGKSVADVLTADERAKLERLMGEPFELPKGVADPFLPLELAGPIDWVPTAHARRFLILSQRLGLTDEQIRRLRELAEDEPRIKQLIHTELGYPDPVPVAAGGRGPTSCQVVFERYHAAVEQQCWDTLDPAQQSIARKIFGRGR